VPFTYDDLLLEVLGARRSYPVVTSFDCSHTVPSARRVGVEDEQPRGVVVERMGSIQRIGESGSTFSPGGVVARDMSNPSSL
jgi:hypothetical protein